MLSAATEITILPAPDAASISAAWHVTASAFGAQTHDAIWTLANPGWETPEGSAQCAARLVKRWESEHGQTDARGHPSAAFLLAKAGDEVVGLAIWVQRSAVEGWGMKETGEGMSDAELKELYPDTGDDKKRRYLKQIMWSLGSRRREVIKEKSGEEVPAVMALDICAVRPEWQGKGIAGRLVQWGIDEAEKRGGLECVLEASVMGRGAYKKKGFVEEMEIVYQVDEEFKDWERPGNMFMRRTTTRSN